MSFSNFFNSNTPTQSDKVNTLASHRANMSEKYIFFHFFIYIFLIFENTQTTLAKWFFFLQQEKEIKIKQR